MSRKDLRLARHFPLHNHIHTCPPTPPTTSHTSLSGCRDLPDAGQQFHSVFLEHFKELEFLLLIVETKCAGRMRVKNMGDVATVNHENTIFFSLKMRYAQQPAKGTPTELEYIPLPTLPSVGVYLIICI